MENFLKNTWRGLPVSSEQHSNYKKNIYTSATNNVLQRFEYNSYIIRIINLAKLGVNYVSQSNWEAELKKLQRQEITFNVFQSLAIITA